MICSLVFQLADLSQWFFVEYYDVHRETEEGHPRPPEYPLPVVGVAVENTTEEGTALAAGRDVVIVVQEETVLKIVKRKVSSGSFIGCIIPEGFILE